MITAEWKPIEEMVGYLRGHKKVLLVGCATCVAECAAGGEREVETLAPLLAMAMQNDGNPIEITSATLERQCEPEFVATIAEQAAAADAIVSVSCGIGMQLMADTYADTPLYPGVNTTSLAIREEPGLWTSRCAACGDCVLGLTFGLCPVARCAKSLMNGPCGGTRENGMCEINEDTPCIWRLIVERATARGQLESLVEVKPPKDWSNSPAGGPKRMLREDLRS